MQYSLNENLGVFFEQSKSGEARELYPLRPNFKIYYNENSR